MRTRSGRIGRPRRRRRGRPRTDRVDPAPEPSAQTLRGPGTIRTRRIHAIPHSSYTHTAPRDAHKKAHASTRPLGVTHTATRRARRFGAQTAVEGRRALPLADEEIVVARHFDCPVLACITHEHSTLPAGRCTAGASRKPPAVILGVLGWPQACPWWRASSPRRAPTQRPSTPATRQRERSNTQHSARHGQQMLRGRICMPHGNGPWVR